MSATAVVMDIQAKRAEVRAAYPGDKWARRVDRMSDEQVLAIWHHKFVENPIQSDQKAETRECNYQPPLPGL